jgi:TadE-like protein
VTGRLARFVRRRIGQATDRGGSVVRAGQGDRGATAIEFTFLTPIMFFMIFGAVQFAMYAFAENVAKAAAQAGARTARAEADADPDGWVAEAEDTGYDYINELGRGLFDGAVSVDATDPSQDLTVVRVDVEGDVPSIMPGIDLTVHASSEGPVERFVPDGGG